MKVTYKFATGEHRDIDIDERWADELKTLDRQELNNDRAQTRRHCSLNGMDYEGDLFADDGDVLSDFLKRQNAEQLCAAINSLLPQQKELIQKVFFEGQSVAGIAREEGVGESAVRDRLSRIYMKIKIFLK